ncbi:hypothetical protein ACWF99_23775 [Nocardia sp. NPDC055002]
MSSYLSAQELSGEHIGSVVEFNWKFPHSNVEALITGELREIHHDGSDEVSLNLCGPGSVGDKTEFTVTTITTVQID